VTSASPDRTRFTARHFWLLLALIALAALAWRVLYVAELVTKNPRYGDGFYYHQQANLIADGHWFANPWAALEGRYTPAAVHPPLYSLVLSISSFFGGTSYLAHKIASCIIGSGAVVVIGLVGRRIASPRAGLLAAALAALYPNLWVIDSLLLAEGLFALLIGLTILAAYRFRDRPTMVSALLLGAAVAAAALVRGEAVFLSVFLVLPLIMWTKDLAWAQRGKLLAVAAAAVVLILGPWVVRNLTTFEEPFLLSSNSDQVLRVANCDVVYDGYLVGFYAIRCGGGIPEGRRDESIDAHNDRRIALDYVSDHLSDVPRVMAARVGRVWEVYRPFQNARLSTLEGRHHRVVRPGLYAFWGVAALGIAGAVVLGRRRVTLIPLMAQLVLVTFTAAMAYGAVRFRIPADVALIALAGVALDAGLTFLLRKRTRAGDVAPPPAPVEDPVGASAS
jgi:4-amino-4-deoxy-L-arabinose transferase-like glycosyltransferase